jgi:hypothetical protein
MRNLLARPSAGESGFVMAAGGKAAPQPALCNRDQPSGE